MNPQNPPAPPLLAAFALAVSVTLTLTLTPAHATEAAFDIAPEPAPWVLEQPVPPPSALVGQRTDIHYLLIDEQVRHHEGAEVRYQRFVDLVGSTAGAHEMTEVRFDFDPSIERLTLHHVRLIRGGVSTDLLDPDELKVVQQERELDRRIYNGEVSVIAFLDDVRVDDQVDWAWTVHHANPALPDRVLHRFALGYGVPVGRLHRRLLLPDDRPLGLTPLKGAPEPTLTRTDSGPEYRWLLTPAPASTTERDLPSWLDPQPHTWVSDFASWADVVSWALPNYTPGAPPPQLIPLIDKWTAATEDPLERARLAVDFVQDDIRYLGIEIGPRGLIPHPSAQVLERRFGDCKDKSMLLVTALSAMGLDAHPALVSTVRGPTLPDLPPTPTAFNHAIATVQIDGTRYWIDPTASLERGDLAERRPPPFAWGLVLAPETRELLEIAAPAPAAPLLSMTERYAVTDLYGPVALDVHTTYRGRDATRMRRTLQQISLSQLQGEWLDHTQRQFPEAAARGPIEVADDPSTGALTVHEAYQLPHLWSRDWFELAAWRVQEDLPSPTSASRTLPLSWRHPAHTVHRVELVLPHRPDIEPDRLLAHSSAFDVVVDRTVHDRTLSLTATYRSLADHVPADEFESHGEAIREARSGLAFHVNPERLAAVVPLWRQPHVLTSMLVLLVLGAGSFRPTLAAVRDRLGHRARARQGGGQTPEDAVLVRDSMTALKTLEHVRCPCGGTLDPLKRLTSDVPNQARSTLEIALPCQACGQPTVRYFRFRD